LIEGIGHSPPRHSLPGGDITPRTGDRFVPEHPLEPGSDLLGAWNLAVPFPASASAIPALEASLSPQQHGRIPTRSIPQPPPEPAVSDDIH
jgi:hypothetical protein